MFNPDTSTASAYMPSLETAGRSLKIGPNIARIHSDAEIEAAINALGREPRAGLVVMPDAFTDVHRANHIGGGPKQRTGGLSPIYLCERRRFNFRRSRPGRLLSSRRH